MFRRALLIALGCTIAVPGAAQVTTFRAQIPCPRVRTRTASSASADTTGSRLGAKKVCKTALDGSNSGRNIEKTVEKFSRSSARGHPVELTSARRLTALRKSIRFKHRGRGEVDVTAGIATMPCKCRMRAPAI